jgi:hypothetical protein
VIAYFIQVHGELPAHLPWLFSLYYDKHNSYFISYDGDAASLADLKDAVGNRPNVHFLHSVPVVWGGATVVSSIIRGIQHALVDSDWEYLINLSGSDVPLWNQATIIARLAAERARGYRNFIHYFGGSWISWEGAQARETESSEVVQSTRFPSILGSPAVVDTIENADVSPIMRWYLRPTFYASENILTKKLHCRFLSPRELEARKQLFTERARFRAGRQWFILSRALCRWIVGSGHTTEQFDISRNIIIPDESFFQTLLEYAPAEERAATLDNNYRYKQGDPVQLTDDVLPFLEKSDALFARKLTIVGSDLVRSFLDERIRPSRPNA